MGWERGGEAKKKFPVAAVYIGAHPGALSNSHNGHSAQSRVLFIAGEGEGRREGSVWPLWRSGE